MSTLHKVKAYFGMAPMDDYEDEYYEDDDRDTGRGRGFSRRRRELRRPPRCRSLRRRPRRCPFGRPV
jgi:FtsZ-interacting cell division protein YlmF